MSTESPPITNELRRRDVATDASAPRSASSAPSENASASGRSNAPAPPTTATRATGRGAVTDGNRQHGSGHFLRLMGLFASVCSQVWGALDSLGFFLGRALQHGHAVLSSIISSRSFAESFEARYGTQHPPFYHGSLRDAFDEARSTQKPLMVYLDDSNPLAEIACREILCSSVFIDVVTSHGFLFVGLSAGSLDAAWLERLLRARQLPCLIFFLPTPALYRHPPRDPQLRWQTLAPRWLHSALQGQWSEGEVLQATMAAVDRYYQDREDCSKKEEEAKQNQILRREQEAAFEEIQRHESLRLSRQREERQQQAEREKRQQEAAEREARKRQERLKQQLLLQQQRAAAAREFRLQDEQYSKLRPEERTTICLRLPSGFRATRVFSRRAALSELHRWASCVSHYSQQEETIIIPEKFDLVVPPKTQLPQEGTLEDARLHPNSVVLLVEVESDEEREASD